MKKITSNLVQCLLALAISVQFACSALTGPGGASVPGGSGTNVNQLDADGASDGSGDGSGGGGGNDGRSSEKSATGDFVAMGAPGAQSFLYEPMPGGFGDPEKHLDPKMFRISLGNFRDVCVFNNGAKHMKVTGYLIPHKDKVGARIIRLIDNYQEYINIKTKDEPSSSGAYQFNFEIVTHSEMHFTFFFPHPTDPDALVYNKELPCTGEKCSPENHISWFPSFTTEDLQALNNPPPCQEPPPQD